MTWHVNSYGSFYAELWHICQKRTLKTVKLKPVFKNMKSFAKKIDQVRVFYHSPGRVVKYHQFLLKMSLIMAKIGQNWSFSVMLGKKYEQPWFGSNLYFHSWDGDSFVHYIVHNALCTLHSLYHVLHIPCCKFHVPNFTLQIVH